MSVQTNNPLPSNPITYGATTQTEPVTTRNKLRLYACGGTGINIFSSWLSTKPAPDDKNYAEILACGIDTSKSNLLPNSDQSKFYFIEGVSGSGKQRAENYHVIAGELNAVFLEFPPETINVVAFSTSGGTGSVTSSLLMSELLKRGETVIALAIVTENSLIETENSRKTLISMEQMAKKLNKPFVSYVVHGKANRQVADEEARYAFSDIAYLFSNQHLELDNTDLRNFVEYQRVTTAPVGLAELKIVSDPSLIDARSALTVAELLPSSSTENGLIPSEYCCTGYPRNNEVIGSHSRYYVTSVESIDQIVNHLEEKVKEYSTLSQARRVKSLIRENDTTEDDGILL